jgi:hypothetical protein
VLGNLDYHTWSKEATAAPVLSQLELWLLTSMAVYNKRVLKTVTSNKPSFNPSYLMMKYIS